MTFLILPGSMYEVSGVQWMWDSDVMHSTVHCDGSENRWAEGLDVGPRKYLPQPILRSDLILGILSLFEGFQEEEQPL